MLDGNPLNDGIIKKITTRLTIGGGDPYKDGAFFPKLDITDHFAE